MGVVSVIQRPSASSATGIWATPFSSGRRIGGRLMRWYGISL